MQAPSEHSEASNANANLKIYPESNFTSSVENEKNLLVDLDDEKSDAIPKEEIKLFGVNESESCVNLEIKAEGVKPTPTVEEVEIENEKNFAPTHKETPFQVDDGDDSEINLVNLEEVKVEVHRSDSERISENGDLAPVAPEAASQSSVDLIDIGDFSGNGEKVKGDAAVDSDRCGDDTGDEMEELKDEVVVTADLQNSVAPSPQPPQVVGEGEVVEILSNLQSMKTPEPPEDGIVRANFVNLTGDDDPPLEILGHHGDHDNPEMDDGPQLIINPELQRIREEQVRKWLIFEQENPIVPADSLAESLRGEVSIEQDSLSEAHFQGHLELQGEGPEGSLENGDMMVVNGTDGMPRRVRFLTDQEGNLLISVFMSKLVGFLLFILKVASASFGVIDLDLETMKTHVTSTSTSNPSSSKAPAPFQSTDLMAKSDPSTTTSTSTTPSLHPPGDPPMISSSNDLVDLTSIFILSTPTHLPDGDVSSMVSDSGNGELIIMEQSNQCDPENPCLVVSPPSLDTIIRNHPTPSAPPMETNDDDDDNDTSVEAPSIILVHPEKFKEPPKEKPPAIPKDEDEIDEGCNSSDETLSVSSCNSMIEITPSNPSSMENVNTVLTNDQNQVPEKPEDPTIITDENNNEVGVEAEVQQSQPPLVDFQLEAPPKPSEEFSDHLKCHSNTGAESQLESTPSEASTSEETSVIIHDSEHDEGMASQNGASAEIEITKLPNIDENNNEVDAIEPLEAPHEEVVPEDMNGHHNNHQYDNPDIDMTTDLVSEKLMSNEMPDLHRSTSSSPDADNDHDNERMTPPADCPPPPPNHGGHPLTGIVSPISTTTTFSTLEEEIEEEDEADDDAEKQMVSLSIQEEHISSVAVTIAKWESMSKAQSTENLSTNGNPSPINNGHTPVMKTSSSPSQISKKSYGIPGSPVQTYAKPVQFVPPTVIHKDKDGNPRVIEATPKVVMYTNSAMTQREETPVILNRPPGWDCWGNKVKDQNYKNGDCHGNGGRGTGAGSGDDDIIYAQPNNHAGSTMTSITNPSAILKSYPKPKGKGEILNWLKEGEIHRAGLLITHGHGHHHHHAPVMASCGQNNHSPVLVSWFFGLISRQQAEKYLHGQPSGTFLVRISTRIWGYTLSYQASTGRTKHFLISATNPAVPATMTAIEAHAVQPPPPTGKQQRMSPFLPQGRYAFIGTNMTPYGTLVSLIRHHSHAPITKLGGEKLLNPCPGGPQIAGLESILK